MTLRSPVDSERRLPCRVRQVLFLHYYPRQARLTITITTLTIDISKLGSYLNYVTHWLFKVSFPLIQLANAIIRIWPTLQKHLFYQQ